MGGMRLLVCVALVAVVAAQSNLRRSVSDMDFAEERVNSLATKVTQSESIAEQAERQAALDERNGRENFKKVELKALHDTVAAALNEVDFDEAAADNNDKAGAPEDSRAPVHVKIETRASQQAAQEGTEWKVVSSNWRKDNPDAKKDDKKDDKKEMELDEDIPVHDDNGSLFDDIGVDDALLQDSEEYTRGINFASNVDETNIRPASESAPAPQHPSSTYDKNLSKPLAQRPDYSCEICMMVMGRKIADTDELCTGLEHNDDRATCWNVVRAMVSYDRYTIDWLYQDGCMRKTKKDKWVQTIPCPPHVLCSWMLWETENVERPFCQFFVNKYKRSEDFHKKHRIPLEVEAADTSEEKQKKDEAAGQSTESDKPESTGPPTEANASTPGGAPESLDGIVPSQ